MKQVSELAKALGFEVVCPGEDPHREVSGGVYCCDLLSIAMGRARSDGVWVTVMANVNAVAVAVLCDVACVVIAEGMAIDETTRQKAVDQGVCLLHTDLPIYDAAKAADRFLSDEA
ncbi:DRTGG domain-containing protein [Provencibacterium massiliense]|uniref:DRTGG domain-containing protein n=1 Tax=Provencibacterium massiliense TaxID=1841868 RepID=UPI0009A58767|nr:DRTGG domain-containing protein [Provencibacterium massiliense]RGB65018.1 hypothetical protein DW086_11165 [Harryflintia acetispora]